MAVLVFTGVGGLNWLGIFLEDEVFSVFTCTCTNPLLSKPLSSLLLEEERFRDLERKLTGCRKKKKTICTELICSLTLENAT